VQGAKGVLLGGVRSRSLLCYGAPRRSCARFKTPHDPAMCWKQLMRCLKNTLLVVPFCYAAHLRPRAGEVPAPSAGLRVHGRRCTALPWICVCTGAGVLPPSVSPTSPRARRLRWRRECVEASTRVNRTGIMRPIFLIGEWATRKLPFSTLAEKPLPP